MISYEKVGGIKITSGSRRRDFIKLLEQEIKTPPVLPDDDDLTICTSQNEEKNVKSVREEKVIHIKD